jgi:hypothetical protein
MPPAMALLLPIPPSHPSAADCSWRRWQPCARWDPLKRVYPGAFESNTFGSSSMKPSYCSSHSVASPTSSVAAPVWCSGSLAWGSIQFSARVSSPSVLWEESYGREGSWEGEFYGREDFGSETVFFSMMSLTRSNFFGGKILWGIMQQLDMLYTILPKMPQNFGIKH